MELVPGMVTSCIVRLRSSAPTDDVAIPRIMCASPLSATSARASGSEISS